MGEKENSQVDEEFKKIVDDFFDAFKALPKETIEKMSENIKKSDEKK